MTISKSGFGLKFSPGFDDKRARVCECLGKIGSLNTLRADLERLLEDWLEAGDSPDAQRRLVAAFALEVLDSPGLEHLDRLGLEYVSRLVAATKK